MTCPVCGEYYFNEETDSHFCKELDLMICDDCLKKVEEYHKVTGKFVVHKCNECGHVKNVEWIPYKNRGRPSGSENKETIKKKKGQKHLTKWIGESSTLEELIHG